MALSEWGQWDDTLDPVTRFLLIRAYMRRKQFEARLISNEIMRGLSGETDDTPDATSPTVRQTRGADGKAYTWVDDPVMFLRRAQGGP